MVLLKNYISIIFPNCVSDFVFFVQISISSRGKQKSELNKLDFCLNIQKDKIDWYVMTISIHKGTVIDTYGP